MESRSKITLFYLSFLIIPIGFYILAFGSLSHTSLGRSCYHFYLDSMYTAKTAYTSLFDSSEVETGIGASYGEIQRWVKFKVHDMKKYDQVIGRSAYLHKLDPDLIRAVILVESKFKENAVSHVGAKGLMQLMPGTAKEMGIKDAFNPEQNILAGSKYLRKMLDRYNQDLELALAAYNAGPGAVSRHGGIPPYRETQQYVKKVKTAYDLLQKRISAAEAEI